MLQRTRIVISGNDATSFLNRLLSNTLHATDQDGSYAMLLEPEGTIIGGGYFCWNEDHWDCYSTAAMAPALREGLQKYIFFRDDVCVAEPQTVELSLENCSQGTFWDSGKPTRLTKATALDKEHSTEDPFPVLRRWAGVPVQGIEIKSGDLPLDWDLGYYLAIKGCYVGQEVVERMWSRARRAKGRVRILSQEPLHDGQVLTTDVGQVTVRAPVLLAQNNGNFPKGLPGDQFASIALGLCKSKSANIELHTPQLLINNNFDTGPDSLRLRFAQWAER